MKQRVPVSMIMSTEMVQLNTSDNLYKAEQLFKKHNIRHIPVVSGKKIVGILSYTDLLRISYADVTDNDTVESTVYDMFDIQQVMAKTPEVVSSKTTIKEVAEILSEREFHALPVVDDEELVGIVTTTDLIKYLLEQY
ncbi:CBS domain-containing protein [Leptobacterium sp. I13]|uniref:CBS domain-containing protein n=1 Tax=Leptobacterium meishanense TaxID=3128904 RepID=UPI0030EC1A99